MICEKHLVWYLVHSKYFCKTYLFLVLDGCLPECMCVHNVHAWSLWMSEEGARSSGTGVRQL